jgi:hypothetical protein
MIASEPYRRHSAGVFELRQHKRKNAALPVLGGPCEKMLRTIREIHVDREEAAE